MEKESIAYFYIQKDTAAKKHLFSKPVLPYKQVERDRLRVTAIGIPEYYRPKYRWKTERMTEELVKYFSQSRAEHYWYAEETAAFMEKNMPEAPLFLMKEMLLCYGVRENLLLIGDPNPLFDHLFLTSMEKVNFLQIVCKNPETYEARTEWLSQNYGTVAVFWQEEVQNTGRGTFLVVDMETGETNGRPRIQIKNLPAQSIYMDMCSESKKQLWIEKKRKDIRYLSPRSVLNKWCHLDTTP